MTKTDLDIGITAALRENPEVARWFIGPFSYRTHLADVIGIPYDQIEDDFLLNHHYVQGLKLHGFVSEVLQSSDNRLGCLFFRFTNKVRPCSPDSNSSTSRDTGS